MRFGLTSLVLVLVGCMDAKQSSQDDNPEQEIIDADGDGFGPEDGDCNDNDPNIHPDAEEVCDNIDNNCNAQIDEAMLKWSWENNDVEWKIAKKVDQVTIDIDDRGWEANDYIADGIADDQHIISFNNQGLRSSYEIDESIDGDIDFQIEYYYSALGILIEEMYDRNADGLIEKRVIYSYDEEERIISIGTDNGGDGEVDSQELFNYDEQGRQIAQEQDADMDGEPESGTYHIFNEQDLLSSIEQRIDGEISAKEEYTYDENGVLLYIDKDSPDDSDAEMDSRHYHTQSDEGVIIEIDQGIDGEIDQIITHKYDESGKLISIEQDFDLDESNDLILDLQYEQGNLAQAHSENVLTGEGELITIEAGKDKSFTVQTVVDMEYFEAEFQNDFTVTCEP